MKGIAYSFILILGVLQLIAASTTATATADASSSMLPASSSTAASPFSSGSSNPAAPPTQQFFVHTERPLMINQVNLLRSSLNNPLLCQDSMLTSIAQQHANDMAAIDYLSHNLPYMPSNYPPQFGSVNKRLKPFGKGASENVVALSGTGSATTAMSQLQSNTGQFSTMMNPAFRYVGVGMAMSSLSGKYYWVQVFSPGNFQGVNCVIEPIVTILSANNRTSTTIQPADGLNLALYPQGITNSNQIINNQNGLYCTLVPFGYAASSSIPLGKLIYPTIKMVPVNATASAESQVTGVLGAFFSALSQASATIYGPSSLQYVPMMVTGTTTLPLSMLSSYVSDASSINPTSLVQSLSSLMVSNPSMSSSASMMLQQFMSSNSISNITDYLMTQTSFTPTASIATTATMITSTSS